MAGTGVFPVHSNKFKIGTAGRASTVEQMLTIKDLESFSLSIDGKKVEWTPLDQEGWMRRAVTAKSIGISFNGKRNYGDPGNDYVAETLLATGQGCETVFEWEFSNGAKLTMDCIIDLSSVAGGDSEDIDNLDFDVLSDGKPNFAPAA